MSLLDKLWAQRKEKLQNYQGTKALLYVSQCSSSPASLLVSLLNEDLVGCVAFWSFPVSGLE